MFNSCGLRGSAGIMAGIILLAALPIAYLQWRGQKAVATSDGEGEI